MAFITEKVNKLITDIISGLSSYISVDKKIRYTDSFDFSDNFGTDVPDIGKVIALIGVYAATAPLIYTFTGGDSVDGAIDLTGQTGMPIAGSFASCLRIYADDEDISQSASFKPSTQKVFAGFSGSETTITIIITF